jgi:hypothetical protein
MEHLFKSNFLTYFANKAILSKLTYLQLKRLLTPNTLALINDIRINTGVISIKQFIP